MSEVIGFLLTFGILAFMLVMSMYAFGAAAEGASARAVELHAESAATRVAGVIVEASVLAESQASSEPSLAYRIDLPEQLEGYDYEIHLEAASGTLPDRLRVTVAALDIDVSSPIFAAAAPSNVNICSTTVAGGGIVVLYDTANVNDPYLPDDFEPSCGAGKFIFLGEA